MTPAEIQETLCAVRETQEIVAIHLKTWLRTGTSAALERLAEARRAEDELMQLVLGEADIANKQLAGRKIKLTDDQIADARRRKSQGESMVSIAKAFDVSAHTVRRWV
jgi:DNA invertase Pin-like site-specific DNA recombinase